jgi:hypothetical protein
LHQRLRKKRSKSAGMNCNVSSSDCSGKNLSWLGAENIFAAGWLTVKNHGLPAVGLVCQKY